MAVWSDMNGFPEGGFPVLANANDMITLGQVYLEPLKFNQYQIDVLGNNRLAGALVIAGALSGVSTLNMSGALAMGGALSGVTTMAANNTVTLSHATAPLTLTGANANISMTGFNSSIGSVLSKIKNIFAKKLTLDERPTVGEDEVALVGDLVSKAPLLHTHSYQPEFTTVVKNTDGYTILGNTNLIIYHTGDESPTHNLPYDTDLPNGTLVFVKVINIASGYNVTLEFADHLNWNPQTSAKESTIVLDDTDIGYSAIFMFVHLDSTDKSWYEIYRSS